MPLNKVKFFLDLEGIREYQVQRVFSFFLYDMLCVIECNDTHADVFVSLPLSSFNSTNEIHGVNWLMSDHHF